MTIVYKEIIAIFLKKKNVFFNVDGYSLLLILSSEHF